MDIGTIVLYMIGIGLVALSCGAGVMRGVSAVREVDPVPTSWAICEAMYHAIAFGVLLIPLTPGTTIPHWQLPLAWVALLATVCSVLLAFAAAGKVGNPRMGKLAVWAHSARFVIAVIPLFGMSSVPTA